MRRQTNQVTVSLLQCKVKNKKEYKQEATERKFFLHNKILYIKFKRKILVRHTHGE